MASRHFAYMDVGTYDLSGAKIMTLHPEHKKAGTFVTALKSNCK